jgi:hypothetical protein
MNDASELRGALRIAARILDAGEVPLASLQSEHGFGLSDPLLQPLQVMILNVFNRDHSSCCTDEGEPPRIENKAVSRQNA